MAFQTTVGILAIAACSLFLAHSVLGIVAAIHEWSKGTPLTQAFYFVFDRCGFGGWHYRAVVVLLTMLVLISNPDQQYLALTAFAMCCLQMSVLSKRRQLNKS